MYTSSARRAGLGDATAAGVDVNDVAATAQVLGVALPAGYATWGDFAKYAYGMITTAQQGLARLQQYPAAMAYAYARAALAVQPHPASSAVVAQLLSDTTAASVPAFATAVRRIVPALWALAVRFAPGEVWDASDDPNAAQRQVEATGNTAWNTALAAGAFTVPAGAAAGFKVPTSLIVAGPVTLPDGTVYLAYHDPRPGASGQFDPAVIWWNGPTFKPATTSGPLVELSNHDMVQLKDRGTGDWYRCMVVYGGDDDTCRPPLSYTGPFTLPPEIARTLQPGSPATHVVRPSVPPAPTPPPASMYAPPVPVGPSAPAPTLYAPLPVVIASPSAPVANGDAPPAMYTLPPVVAPSSTPAPAAPIIPSLYQSPGVVGGDTMPAVAPAPAPGSSTDWLFPVLLAIGIGGVVLGDRARRRRK